MEYVENNRIWDTEYRLQRKQIFGLAPCPEGKL